MGLFVLSASLALTVARHYNLGIAGTLITVLFSGGGLGAFYLAWKSYADNWRDAARKEALPDIADDLANVVRKQAKTAAAGIGLDDPEPLPVSWGAADPSLTDSWDRLRKLSAGGAGWPRRAPSAIWVDGPDDLAGSGSDLADLLGRIPAGRLLVLGEAGAGKTSLMIRLVLDLLEYRGKGGPVPVMIPIADWNPAQDGLLKWLKAKIIGEYPGLAAPAPGNCADSRFGALLHARLILPILDGLDEIPDALRRLAIDRINEAFTAGESLVVTSRTEAYRQAVRPPLGARITLRGAAGIELRPLKAADVVGYLREEAAGVAAESRWQPVVAALQAEAPVARVLTTPLMVHLADEIYNPRRDDHAGAVPDPADLCAYSSSRDIEHHLLETSIRAAYRTPRGERGPRWSAGQTERWLTFLAVHAKDNGNAADVAWWQVNDALPRLLAGLVVGGVSLVTFGLAGWIAGGQYRVRYALAYGLAFGLAGGLSFGFRSCKPSRVQFRFRGASVTILRRCALGTVIGLVFALTIGQPTVLAAGAVIGLMFGAHGWMSTPTRVDREPSPWATLRQDRSGTLGTGLIAGLALGIVGGLDVAANISGSGSTPLVSVGVAVVICASAGAFLGKLEYGWIGTITYGIAGGVVGLLATAWRPVVSGMGPGLAFGIAFGLSVALAIMAPRAWGSFAISRVLLAARGDLPWRIMTFLEDARERGLLRQSGAVYQFRHALLREHLAGKDAESREKTAKLPARPSADAGSHIGAVPDRENAEGREVRLRSAAAAGRP